MKVGFIGLGAMGTGMANNLANAGLLTAVYNRTESKAHNLSAKLNVAVCTSPQQLGKQADVIMICVSADKDVLEMVSAVADTVSPGAVVIDTSTVSNETAKEAAAILSKKQAAFLDAPVSGGVEGAKNASLAMMVGGNKEALDSVRPVLGAISSRIVHMGETGSGQTTKAVNQIMAAGINQAVTEALAFGQVQGLAMDKVIEAVSGGAAGNWFLKHRGAGMTNGLFEPGFKLSLHHKDLIICQHMAQHTEASIDLAAKTVSDYKRLMDQGFGDEDISALYRLKLK